MCQLFFHEESIYEISKTLACMVQKLCYPSKSVTDTPTDGRTNIPEAIYPSNFFEVGGINTEETEGNLNDSTEIKK